MILIEPSLKIQSIKSSDYTTLFNLMKEIYPPAYSHFWEDNGDWYLNYQYSKENFLKELYQENSDYYFVIFENEIIGNFRIIWNEKLRGFSVDKHVKLHRLYLHNKHQGKGIGKKLLSWLENKAVQKNFDIIWLDAMYEQQQAFQFYKKQGYKNYSHTFLQFENMFDKYRKMSQVYKLLI
jgi:GNAT superfamily N-acetyltransferase